MNRPGFSGECFVQHSCGFFDAVLLFTERALRFVRRPVDDGAARPLFAAPVDPFGSHSTWPTVFQRPTRLTASVLSRPTALSVSASSQLSRRLRRHFDVGLARPARNQAWLDGHGTAVFIRRAKSRGGLGANGPPRLTAQIGGSGERLARLPLPEEPHGAEGLHDQLRLRRSGGRAQLRPDVEIRPASPGPEWRSRSRTWPVA